jgi:uncharacterized circularly permuted ATP-grasp superfamily protein/uncharacterized alpha-E superfamily protein
LADRTTPQKRSSPTAGHPEPSSGAAEVLDYGPVPIHDEMVTGDGRLRPHWRRFMGSLGPLGGADLSERWEEARRLLRRNGVTYNVHGDPQGMERPWPLDMMPLLIPFEEWGTLQDGLAQRATLLNAVLADLYGDGKLLRSGIVPPALVHADPGFLRPCSGIRPPGSVWLHLYAADVTRAPDGRWQVLGDRTQSPSGAGYALENRAVVSQILAEAFAECGVQRLGPFFATLKATLERMAPRPRAEGPRIVLLTPGPYNETYFEHAYLARHLGLTLVEGEDLTVRDRQVFLKTLSGLEPVDVILRRLDDDFADPLELRADSSLGVPGLVQALRAGTVAVANALGCGLAESNGLLPLLPALCRHLLDEELKLPSVATWWCGSKPALDHVMANMGELVLMPAHADLGIEPVFGGRLDAAGRAEMAARIRSRPVDWVAQEHIPLSTSPAWLDGRLQPRPLVLRVYLAWTPSGYIAMPGGLTRISTTAGRLIVSMQHGGGSKDAWVMSPESSVPRQPSHALEAGVTDRATPLRTEGGDLPSRVADGLYWVGRYAERAEASARLLRAVLWRLTDADLPGSADELVPLTRLMAWLGMTPRGGAPLAELSGRDLRRTVQEMIFDGGHAASLRSGVVRLYRAAAGVRDRLSLDQWRVIGRLDRLTGEDAARLRGIPWQAPARFDDMVTTFAALSGLEHEVMAHGSGWRFLTMGRRIERMISTMAAMTGTGLVPPSNISEPASGAATLEVLLELAESTMTYRERYAAAPQRVPVLHLLLADKANPRSLAFQLTDLARHIAQLPSSPSGSAGGGPRDAAAGLIAGARAAVADQALLDDAQALSAALDRFNRDIPAAAALLAQAYLTHAFARPA